MIGPGWNDAFDPRRTFGRNAFFGIFELRVGERTDNVPSLHLRLNHHRPVLGTNRRQ
jgi:hypothetical protein